MVMGVYRKVDVYRSNADTTGRPQLSVSNHFGGFADPLLLIYAMPRLPRIIARDVIWKFPLVGTLMRWVGAIPVHKPEDRGKGSNDVMFASAYGALEERSHLMIFPEGITRDEPSIAPIKTGAARIALGARTNGVDGILIRPAGIHYEDKAALRSSVSIQIGPPMDLDATIDHYVERGADAGPDNRAAVRALTDDIERNLRRVAPDFTDWEEARSLTHASEMLLRSLADDPAAPVPLAARDLLAGFLGRKPAANKARIRKAVESYDQQLDALGLTDAQLLSGMTGRRFVLRLVGWLLLSVVLLPFALMGALINWIPWLIVKAVGLLRVAPAVLATLKPITAVVTFAVAWGIAAWAAFRNNGVEFAFLAILMMPIYLAAVIVFVERVQALWTGFRAWRGLVASAHTGDAIEERRRDVLELLVQEL